jgi:hypothetical protein
MKFILWTGSLSIDCFNGLHKWKYWKIVKYNTKNCQVIKIFEYVDQT